MPENNPGTTELLTPSQRLEQSRRALLETMRPGATAAMQATRQAAEDVAQQAETLQPPSPVVAQAPSFVAAAATEPRARRDLGGQIAMPAQHHGHAHRAIVQHKIACTA